MLPDLWWQFVMKPAPVIMHSLKPCLEKLTSNLEIVDQFMFNPGVKEKKTQQQQTGDNDVSQEAQKFNQKCYTLLLGLHSRLLTCLYLLGITVSEKELKKKLS